MAFPTTTQELDSLLERMSNANAPQEEMQIVYDEFKKTKLNSTPITAEQQLEAEALETAKRKGIAPVSVESPAGELLPPVTPKAGLELIRQEQERRKPQTSGERMLKEFQQKATQDPSKTSLLEKAETGAKGIGAGISLINEKAVEGFANLGDIIGVATSGVDLTDEQKAQIFEDIEVEKKTQEYKDFISEKGRQLGFAESLAVPSATFSKIPAATTKTGKLLLGGLAGSEAATTQAVALRGELPTTTELITGTGLGVLIPSVGITAGKIKKFLGKTLPPKLFKSALKFTPTQKSNLSQITAAGETVEDLVLQGKSQEEIVEILKKKGDVFDWLIKKGFKGSPQEIAIQLAKDANKAIKTKKDVLSKVKGIFTEEATGVAPRQILEELKDSLTGIAGKEKDLLKATELLDEFNSAGLSVSKLDEVKTFFDKNSSIFKLGGVGNVKGGLKFEGLANLRRGLKEFIEEVGSKEGLNVAKLNNDIQAAKSVGNVLQKRDLEAGGNAVLSLTDAIVGTSVGTGEYARTGSLSKALRAAFAVTVSKKVLQNPTALTWIAKALQKTFNEGEAGAIIKLLNGEQVKIAEPIKNKFRSMFSKLKTEIPELSNEIKL